MKNRIKNAFIVTGVGTDNANFHSNNIAIEICEENKFYLSKYLISEFDIDKFIEIHKNKYIVKQITNTWRIASSNELFDESEFVIFKYKSMMLHHIIILLESLENDKDDIVDKYGLFTDDFIDDYKDILDWEILSKSLRGLKFMEKFRHYIIFKDDIYEFV